MQPEGLFSYIVPKPTGGYSERAAYTGMGNFLSLLASDWM